MRKYTYILKVRDISLSPNRRMTLWQSANDIKEDPSGGAGRRLRWCARPQLDGRVEQLVGDGVLRCALLPSRTLNDAIFNTVRASAIPTPVGSTPMRPRHLSRSFLLSLRRICRALSVPKG
jgi:hypothetical protein